MAYILFMQVLNSMKYRPRDFFRGTLLQLPPSGEHIFEGSLVAVFHGDIEVFLVFVDILELYNVLMSDFFADPQLPPQQVHLMFLRTLFDTLDGILVVRFNRCSFFHSGKVTISEG